MKTRSVHEIVNAVYARLPSSIQSRARALVTPKLKRTLRTAANRAGVFGPNQPLLSVIVPVYNVSDHLAECLASISAQTYRHTEIIVIDDGSTDDSLKIARNIAKSDRRITVHTQQNAGLGAARNVGVHTARGKYLVFADSDDFVPPNAYETMVRTLQASGSDLVTGTFYRFNSTTHEVPRWAKRVHAERRLRITLEDYLDGLVNVYAWNKMFRKTFWDTEQITYTEGVRYEDQEPTTRMFLRASSIDVIPDSVYGYRLREDQSSITQTKHLIRDVQDRLYVIKLTAKTIDESGSLEVKEAWIAKVIRFDVLPYIREGINADSAYQSVVAELCRFVYETSDESAIDHAPVKIRALMALVLSGHWTKAGEAMLFSDETGPHLPTLWNGRSGSYAPPFTEEIDPDLRKFGLTLSIEETKAVAAVRYAAISADGQIQLDGWAFIKNLDLDNAHGAINIQVLAVNNELDRRVPMTTILSPFPGATRWAASKWNDYEASGFSASISTSDLAELTEGSDSGQSVDQWAFVVEIETAGVRRATPLDRRVSGSSAGFLRAGAEVDDVDWQWSFDSKAGLILAANKEVVQISPAKVGQTIEMALTAENAIFIKSARLVRGRKKIIGTVKRGTIDATVSFDLDKILIEKPHSWTLKLSGTGLLSDRLTLPKGASRHVLSKDYAVRRAESGALHLDVLPQQMTIHAVEILDEVVKLRGTGSDPGLDTEALSLRLVSTQSKSVVSPVIWNESEFVVEIPVIGSSKEPLPFDGYSLRAADGDGRERPIVFDQRFAKELPLEITQPSHRLRITSTKFGNAWIRLSAPLHDSEVGQLKQKHLQSQYRSSSPRIEPNTVLFHAYLGAQATDSSLAISKYLLENRPEIRVIWATISETVEIPEGSERVILNSKRWYDALASAGYLVHNIYFDPWFELKPGQKYIQTWHGTPLKSINLSYWRGIGRQQAWIDRMVNQARSWTYLLSPSPYYSEIVAQESGFEGQILEMGYPRNDELAVNSYSDQRRYDVRRQFGFQTTDRVVLYAPTWREHLSSRSWQAEMVQFLDSQALMNDLGDGYKLLIRGHGHNARTASSKEGDSNVLDVTHYPNINDLYLAADVIVTDYSSVMFDAVVANKPLVFFVPDLDEYNSSARGVYLDLAQIAPGPLVFAQHELVETLRNFDSMGLTSTDSYRLFKEKFAPLDDGCSTKRVVEEIWG